MEDSWLAKGAPGRVAINSAAEKKLWPLLLNCKCELVKILVNQSYYYKES